MREEPNWTDVSVVVAVSACFGRGWFEIETRRPPTLTEMNAYECGSVRDIGGWSWSSVRSESHLLEDARLPKPQPL